MTISDWLMILAVLLGPLIAVQLTRYLDRRNEEKQRKLWVFKTLMASRASTLSLPHVEALNRIDLEFHPKSRREREVLEAWKAYLDLLSDHTLPPDQWKVRQVDLLVELLHRMARVLNYDFDKTAIKNSSYAPRGYSRVEEDQAAIRQGMKDLFEGKRVVPVHLTNIPASRPGDEAGPAVDQ
jgi:hypothetical protein